MQSKEVKKWQDEEALKRYQMIAPLLDENLDEAKRCQIREEIAARYEISKRSLYRYEAKYREEAFDGLRPMNREKRRRQALPENYDEIVGVISVVDAVGMNLEAYVAEREDINDHSNEVSARSSRFWRQRAMLRRGYLRRQRCKDICTMQDWV